MPKGVPNKRYTPEFKQLVIETMLEEKLSYRETARRFEVNDHHRIQDWERINLILHSDQGWQYQHKRYQRMPRQKGIRQSMSRFESMEHFKRELIAYLDYYNNRRIKAKQKGLPPAIHRQQALSAA